MTATVMAASMLGAPATALDMPLAPHATVATQCSIAEIHSDDGASGHLRVQARCNAESYRIQLISNGTPVAIDSAEITTSGARIRLLPDQIWVTQDRPGSREIAIRLAGSEPVGETITIRIEAL